MTARDDYPVLAAVATSVKCREMIEASEALDEIDLLRAAAKYGSASRSQDERRP